MYGILPSDSRLDSSEQWQFVILYGNRVLSCEGGEFCGKDEECQRVNSEDDQESQGEGANVK
jgi:hypothetical protein